MCWVSVKEPSEALSSFFSELASSSYSIVFLETSGFIKNLYGFLKESSFLVVSPPFLTVLACWLAPFLSVFCFWFMRTSIFSSCEMESLMRCSLTHPSSTNSSNVWFRFCTDSVFFWRRIARGSSVWLSVFLIWWVLFCYRSSLFILIWLSEIGTQGTVGIRAGGFWLGDGRVLKLQGFQIGSLGCGVPEVVVRRCYPDTLEAVARFAVWRGIWLIFVGYPWVSAVLSKWWKNLAWGVARLSADSGLECTPARLRVKYDLGHAEQCVSYNCIIKRNGAQSQEHCLPSIDIIIKKIGECSREVTS